MEVEVGNSNDDYIEIVSGLSEGDEIAYMKQVASNMGMMGFMMDGDMGGDMGGYASVSTAEPGGGPGGPGGGY